MNKAVLYILLFLVAAAAGFTATYFITKDSPRPSGTTGILAEVTRAEEPRVPEPVVEAPTTEEPVVKVPAVEEPVMEAPVAEAPKEEAPKVKPVATEPEFEIVLSGKKVEAVGEGLFRLSGIRTKGGSGAAVKYTLRDSEGHAYESLDGTFPEVQANTKGTYALKATETTTGRTAKPKYISGFKFVKPVEKLSASELTALFNTGNGENLDKVRSRVVAKPKVICNTPGVITLSAILSAVNMDGLRANVTGVSYDANGKVSEIKVDLQ